jgi:hypothetical protein
LPEPGRTPILFFIKDELTLLHIVDAHDVDYNINLGVLCLPWRKKPIGSNQYKKTVLE